MGDQCRPCNRQNEKGGEFASYKVRPDRNKKFKAAAPMPLRTNADPYSSELGDSWVDIPRPGEEKKKKRE